MATFQTFNKAPGVYIQVLVPASPRPEMVPPTACRIASPSRTWARRMLLARP